MSGFPRDAVLCHKKAARRRWSSVRESSGCSLLSVRTELYELHFPVKNQEVHPVDLLCNKIEDNYSGEEKNTMIEYFFESHLYILISHFLV